MKPFSPGLSKSNHNISVDPKSADSNPIRPESSLSDDLPFTKPKQVDTMTNSQFTLKDEPFSDHSENEEKFFPQSVRKKHVTVNSDGGEQTNKVAEADEEEGEDIDKVFKQYDKAKTTRKPILKFKRSLKRENS